MIFVRDGCDNCNYPSRPYIPYHTGKRQPHSVIEKGNQLRTMSIRKTILALLLILVMAACTAQTSEEPQTEQSSRPTVTVFKSPSCGCCDDWVAYLEEHGYEVRAEHIVIGDERESSRTSWRGMISLGRGYETCRLLALSSRRCEPGKPGYERNGLQHRSKIRCKLSSRLSAYTWNRGEPAPVAALAASMEYHTLNIPDKVGAGLVPL